jgi:hypothetical protein
MNERIRELAKEAGIFYYRKGKLQVDMEKFAELIVRECAEYAEQELDMAGYKKKFMLKHFGVEEK